MITALAWHLNDSIYGWMLAITAIQDLAVAAYIFSSCSGRRA